MLTLMAMLLLMMRMMSLRMMIQQLDLGVTTASRVSPCASCRA
jgi:hypothetical protein